MPSAQTHLQELKDEAGLKGLQQGYLHSTSDFTGRYLYLLLFTLAGYAFMGKGFAYVGYPPFLIGEISLVLGLIAICWSGSWVSMFMTLPSLLLATLIALVVTQASLDVGTYGLDALRDGAIVLYGLFAFVVVALLLERPERLWWIAERYGRFAWVFGWIATAPFYATIHLQTVLPVWPQSGVTVIYVKLGEAATHLAGAAVFALLGLRKVSVLWAAAVIVGVFLVTPSRGAMLSCVIPITVAVILSGQVRRVAPACLVALSIFALAYVFEVEVALPGGRSLSATQIWANFESLLGTTATSNLDGTKAWRLAWWRAIEDYTLHGPYFWTGKGYGFGLAEADGFVVGAELGGPIVRSPHNAHFTMLARSGVPGLVLWITTGLAWYVMLIRSMYMARQRGEERWSNLFLWNICYVSAIIINATFDVALEGPMQSIWFWSLFGFGIGASMIYRWEVAGGGAASLHGLKTLGTRNDHLLGRFNREYKLRMLRQCP